MPKYNVQVEDVDGGLHSYTVEADDDGHASDLALEQAEAESVNTPKVIDVEEEA